LNVELLKQIIMARFFVAKENIRGRRGSIRGQELRHLSRVLHLGAGDGITVIDDAGTEHDAIIRLLGSEEAEFEIISSRETQRESPLDLTLALGLTKGNKMDLVIEKATELGVRRIVPFASNYSVAKLDPAKAVQRLARWQRIAVSAVKQCGRTRAPEISPVCDFGELLHQTWPDTLRILLWEKQTGQSLWEVRDRRGHAAVLIGIGPEGGFSAEEARDAEAHGFELMTLGQRILRAETAAIVAASLAQFLWGDLR
jgi:16S rRNA (uracil1498-N3)-methyltransferase